MRIFISAGEPSGDLHAANLIHALRERAPDAEFVGYGGPRMAEAGATLLYPLVNLAVMWFLSVFLNIATFIRLVVRADRYFRDERPDAVVLVDYPGLHWWIAKRARARGVPVFYFVPPQLWAWAGWRVKKVRENVDLVLCSLPFEPAWYHDRGVPQAVYVGHPYFDELQDRELDETFLKAQEADGRPVLAILPGSRTLELKRNLPILASAAAKLAEARPDVRFVVACLHDRHKAFAEEIIGRTWEAGGRLGPKLEVLSGRTPELIRLADVAWSVSGSVCLELMMEALPTVILYKIRPFDLWVARKFIKSKYITLVNLLADAELMPEYLTAVDVSADLARWARTWLDDPKARARSTADLAALRHTAARPGAACRAADHIFAWLRDHRAAAPLRPPIAAPTTCRPPTLSRSKTRASGRKVDRTDRGWNPPMARPWRLLWLLVLGLHFVAALGWWWLTPGGFPLSHSRFWSNRVAPVVVLAVVATAVLAARRERLELLRTSLAAFPAIWAAAAVVGRLVFPITLGRLFLVPLIGAALMAGAVVLTFRRKAPATGWPIWGVAVVAALFGAVLPLSQRPPPPDTRPLDVPTPEPRAVAVAASPNGRLSERLFIHTGDGSATVKAGGLTLSVQPLLRFLARSPDGCLTILAPRAIREGPDLRLASAVQDENGLALRYRADYDATLRVAPDAGGGPIVLEATARLTRPIESHLNSFCDLEVTGHKRLALSFSPCPDQRIEVRPADYPVGRPLRFAYMDAVGGFHVVEGTSGEKGPFRELAGGRLDRSESLAVTLHDGDAAVARITLDDWPAQAGTALSPTAGWGAAVNAIEFSLEGDEPGSRAAIYITLAGTSVGRGWDCVGHAAGTYRNRLRIESLRDRPAAEPAGNPGEKRPLP